MSYPISIKKNIKEKVVTKMLGDLFPENKDKDDPGMKYLTKKTIKALGKKCPQEKLCDNQCDNCDAF
jgi:hypothetical protein